MCQLREKERAIIFIVLVFFDQFLKLLALKNSSFVLNYGAAFDLSISRYLVISLLLFFLFLYFKTRKFSVLLILSGGVSNFFDRIFRGGVIDFIRLPLLPVFNLADMLICLGAILFLLKKLR